jgi:hypothetical protein
MALLAQPQEIEQQLRRLLDGLVELSDLASLAQPP